MCHNFKQQETTNQPSQRDLVKGFVTTETLKQTLFLTVQSDPGAEREWQRFSCNDAVRLTSPDFLKSLQQLFAGKPAGQYLVKVEVTLDLTQLDFEPRAIDDPDLEAAADASYYASNATQAVCLNTAVQTEAGETSDLPWALEDEETSVTGDLQTADVLVVAAVKEQGSEREFDQEPDF
jgi:hypothetical protein